VHEFFQFKKNPFYSIYYRTGTVANRDAPDTVFSGYPANPKAGYRNSGRISGKGRIPDIRPDIRPDTWLGNYI
jgi:hypothetical protein